MGVLHSSASFCSQNSNLCLCFSAIFSDLLRLSLLHVKDFVRPSLVFVFVFVSVIVGGLGAEDGSVG